MFIDNKFELSKLVHDKLLETHNIDIECETKSELSRFTNHIFSFITTIRGKTTTYTQQATSSEIEKTISEESFVVLHDTILDNIIYAIFVIINTIFRTNIGIYKYSFEHHRDVKIDEEDVYICSHTTLSTTVDAMTFPVTTYDFAKTISFSECAQWTVGNSDTENPVSSILYPILANEISECINDFFENPRRTSVVYEISKQTKTFPLRARDVLSLTINSLINTKIEFDTIKKDSKLTDWKLDTITHYHHCPHKTTDSVDVHLDFLRKM